MFINIGGKIKGLAKFVFWLVFIMASAIGILAAGIDGFVFIGLPCGLIAWLFTFLFYGFGQLIENSDNIIKNQNTIIELLNNEQK